MAIDSRTPAGSGCKGWGLTPGLPNGRRRYAYRCLDWSERRDHLAGQLAEEIFQHFAKVGWLRRSGGRAVELTARGEKELLPALQMSGA